MATKQKERPQVKFINVRLQKDRKDEFDKWVEKGLPDLFNEVGNFLQAQNKLGISWDGKNNCFIVSATCWEPGGDNYGLCFSTRNADPKRALELTMFKLLVVLENGDWLEGADNDDWG